MPSALSATIAIQAQDPRSIADIDGVTFAAFNRSIKNRLISNDIISSFARTQRDIRGQRRKIMSQQSNLRNHCKVIEVIFLEI